MTVGTIDIRERAYVVQYSTDAFGLNVVVSGTPTDVDGQMLVTFEREGDPGSGLANSLVFQRDAAHNDTGDYSVIPTATETSVPGLYTIVWAYSLGGVAQHYETYIQIGIANQHYDALNDDMRSIVETTWMRFSDLFDSPGGGPNLQTYFQTHWDRGRVAQLLKLAVGTLNTVAQPWQTYTIDGVGGAEFPVAMWGALLERCLYVECIKHLRRTYTEQPMPNGSVNVTYLDRRDYLQRWGEILTDEEATLRGQLDAFKIANMGMGKPAILVSGGVYGRYGPTRVAGSIAARPRYFTRWY